MAEEQARYWDFIDLTYKAADIYHGPEAFMSSIASEPREAVLLYAAHFCQSEVHNGGLLQFFWNGTGVLAPEAVEGFTAIGMPQLAALLKMAVELLGDPYPRDRDERWDALLTATGLDQATVEAIFEATDDYYLAFVKATEPLNLDGLDEQFWKLAKTENGGFREAADRYATNIRLM